MSTEPQARRIADEWIRLFRKRDDYYVIDSPQTILAARRSPVVQFINEFCGVTGREEVLEAGCGSGLFGFALALAGCRCTELDLSQQMLTNVENAAEMLRSHGHDIAITAEQGDLLALPAPDGAYDIVFNEGVIEHWTDPADRLRVVREMVRVARSGGRVVVCIPNNSHPLYRWWYWLQRKFHSGYLVFRPGGALEESVISADDLERELGSAGLIDVVTDGFAVTRTIAHYPRWLPLRAVAKGLEQLLPPFPQSVRRKWGVYLLAGGVKP